MSLPDSNVHNLIIHSVLSNMQSGLRVPKTAVLCQICESRVLQPLTVKHVLEVAAVVAQPRRQPTTTHVNETGSCNYS